jgi:tetratricopeptide (TPR) repeat protein
VDSSGNPFTSSTPQTAADRERLGDAYSSRGQFVQAELEYRAAIKLDANNALLHYKLALMLLNQGDLGEAKIELNQVIKLSPNYFQAYYQLGRIAVFEGDINEVEKNYLKVVELQPSLAEAHATLADTYRIKKDYPKAETYARETIKLAPDLAEGHFLLASILFELQKWEECEKTYIKTISLDPFNADAHNNLAYLYIEIGRFDEAREPIREAERLGLGGQGYFEATKLGMLIPDAQKEEQAGNLDKAASLYQQAADAENTLGFYYLGILERKRNRIDQAAEAFNRYIKEGRMASLKADAAKQLKEMGK